MLADSHRIVLKVRRYRSLMPGLQFQQEPCRLVESFRVLLSVSCVRVSLMKVSYKPQTISAKFEGTVKDA